MLGVFEKGLRFRAREHLRIQCHFEEEEKRIPIIACWYWLDIVLVLVLVDSLVVCAWRAIVHPIFVSVFSSSAEPHLLKVQKQETEGQRSVITVVVFSSSFLCPKISCLSKES